MEVPVFFIRYEDLLADSFSNLCNIFQFIFGVDSIKGTFIERRIEEVVAEGGKANTVYTPRTGNMNTNYAKYSQE